MLKIRLFTALDTDLHTIKGVRNRGGGGELDWVGLLSKIGYLVKYQHALHSNTRKVLYISSRKDTVQHPLSHELRKSFCPDIKKRPPTGVYAERNEWEDRENAKLLNVHFPAMLTQSPGRETIKAPSEMR